MQMLTRQFTDRLSSKLPAFEQSVLKLRAMQMLLVLFYAEELKRDVLGLVRGPDGTKNAVDKALNALIVDRVISDAEKTEIVALINYRNVISHQIHNLLADISRERLACNMVVFAPELLQKYDYVAVQSLQHFHKRLREISRTQPGIRTVRYNRLLFGAAEKTFLAEIRRLKGKITRLSRTRRAQIDSLNTELLSLPEFEENLHPNHPLNQYDGGRWTKRGVEICYRLFDIGKSAMAVAHLTGHSPLNNRPP